VLFVSRHQKFDWYCKLVTQVFRQLQCNALEFHAMLQYHFRQRSNLECDSFESLQHFRNFRLNTLGCTEDRLMHLCLAVLHDCGVKRAQHNNVPHPAAAPPPAAAPLHVDIPRRNVKFLFQQQADLIQLRKSTTQMHQLKHFDDKKLKRCKFCNQQTTTFCSVCTVALCNKRGTECFQAWHHM